MTYIKRGKHVKKKIRIILVIGAMLFMVNSHQVCATDAFSGCRRTTCVIRQSDLNNFVSGGRNTLNTILVQNQAEWYTCNLLSSGQEVELSLEFSFVSYEDYVEKVERLTGYKPITTYPENDVYLENFVPGNLFHFIDSAMQNADVVEEQSFCEMLRLKNDTLEVNGTIYHGVNAANMSSKSKIQFTDIEIYTEMSEGKYLRTIELSLEEGDRNAGKELENRCSRIKSTWEENNNYHYRVEFSADSEEKLIRDTMILLGTTVNITHDKYYKSDEYVRMSTKEIIDIESVLTEEGQFSYSVTVPETYENLALTIEMDESDENNLGMTINEYSISYEGRDGVVEYYFDEPFKFEKIAVATDISDEFQKIKRTLTLYQSKSLAEDYHEFIKEKIRKRMKRGDTLRIYDTNEYRCYEISYSSWFADDINLFTNRMFKINNSRFSVRRSAILFVESKLSDYFSIEKGDIKSYSGNIDVVYRLPNNTRVLEDVIRNDEETRFEMISGFEMSFNKSFSALYYKMLIAYVVIIVLLCLGCWIGFLKINHTFKNWRIKKKNKSKRKNIHITYCPKCGMANNSESKYCAKCRNEFK